MPEQDTMQDTEQDVGGQDGQIQVNIPPDLDYQFRDLVNVYPTLGDVLLEFGNIHRSLANQISISDRLVIPMHVAIRLTQILQNAIQQAQEAVQQQMDAQASGQPARSEDV